MSTGKAIDVNELTAAQLTRCIVAPRGVGISRAIGLLSSKTSIPFPGVADLNL